VRAISVRVLVVVATFLLVGATATSYAWLALFDADRFVDRATAALDDQGVRAAIAERVTDDVVLRQEPDLLAARPLVASAVAGVIGGDAFASLFRRGVRDVHRAVFHADRNTVTLTLVDVGIVASEAARRLAPAQAAQLEDASGRVQLLRRDVGGATGEVARRARQLRALAIVLAVLLVAVAAAAIALAADKRETVEALGKAMIAAGLLVVCADLVARALALDRIADPVDRAAARGVWDAFLGDLRTTGWLLSGSGAVVAAAAASLIRPVDVEGPLVAAWRVVVTEPERPALRLVRGAGLVVVGMLVILQPATAVRLAATLAGVYVLYKGVEAIMHVLARPRAPEPVEAPARRLRLPSPRIAVSVLAAVLVGAACAAFVGSGGAAAPAADLSRCNGLAALCDRPLDEVTFPATHNAMSAPQPGWFSSLQEEPIAVQLTDGVRGLLIDTHYADRLDNGRVRTFYATPGDLSAAIKQDGVSEDSEEAALRLRDRLGFRGEGERGVYLCHTFCELGATPLAAVLEDLRAFLVTHPADVLVIVHQDAITPEDFVAAIGEAGLARYAITPPAPGAPWPTLGELVAQDRRLLVVAENAAGGAPWYQLAYDRLVQETPYEFPSTASLTLPANRPASCVPNRGPDDAPLFLMNHWVNTDPVPRPSNAALVNAYEPLLARARACAQIRGRHVNLLAVDFYRHGDLFRVAAALNGG
jgi:hypothetical protein